MTQAAAPAEIQIRGASEHNLRGIDVAIPREKLVVITGLSGSGKSSLAFDTLYAEGQRRYVESLSAYARQFIDQWHKPEVESIDGLSPSISIEQKTTSRSPRSTVGTATEIYDYLRLLYARAGLPHCPDCGVPIERQTPDQMADRVLALPEGTAVEIRAPVVRGRKGVYKKELLAYRRQGFVRVVIDGETRDLSEDIVLARQRSHEIELVVDRLRPKPAARARIVESIRTALRLASGLVLIHGGPEPLLLSERNACPRCAFSFPEIAPRMFSFNSSHGACTACAGLGTARRFDPERIVPDPSKSLAEGAIEAWSGRKRYYRDLLASVVLALDIDPELPFEALPAHARKALLHGTGKRELELTFTRSRGRKRTVERRFDGVIGELERRLSDGDATHDELARFMSPAPCEVCAGTRLRAEARNVKIAAHTLPELASQTLEQLTATFAALELPAERGVVAERVLREIEERLRFLLDVGVGYLTLDRPSTTLSGGESQRIRLATQVGSSLMGVLYILDEPSIGLHPRDHGRLLSSLARLRDLGNSVVVVEHDEATMRAADHLIDMGPGAGVHGGEIVAAGTPQQVMANDASLTGAYLAGTRAIPVPEERREPGERRLVIEDCHEHNLRHLRLELPLGCLVVVTGVSGSGKSTLIEDTLFRRLDRDLHGAQQPVGAHGALHGLDDTDKVIAVDQGPIGRSPRSNPCTYTGAFDGIRNLFSQVPESRVRGYGPGRFSFNVKGGRCEACQGDGALRIEMHFLPDVFVPCEVCRGRRYNRETLEIRYRDHTIADVLEASVEEALPLFEAVPRVQRPLQTLADVGLGYLHLGQSATTLSGGEAQRIKLARELARKATGRTLYLLDEPTTGLHFADIERLLAVLQRLVDKGNTVVVIEHQLDVIKCADWVIDLGPEGGAQGGDIVVAGPPERVRDHPQSHTGRALCEVLP